MINLTANGAKKYLKTSFTDVTLGQLSDAYGQLAQQSAVILDWLNKDKECPESDMFEFKMFWVSLFSDFTLSELKLIPMHDKDSLSVEFLFDQCKLFIYQPKVALDIKEFKLKGKIYKLIEPIRTISGASMLFGNASYRQWMLGNQLSKMVTDNQNDKCIEGLIQLLAVIYTDNEDIEKDLTERVKAFRDVDALTGWSGYFFFALLLKKYSDYFQLSTKSLRLKKVQSQLTLEQSKQRLSKTFIGRLLPSKLLNSEFLILEM